MTAPLTCTWHEAQILDLTEAVMLNDWRAALLMEPRPTHDRAYQQRAEFVLGLITGAVNFDPRYGLPMDACHRHGCSTLVDENGRDPDTGHLFCSEDCRDDYSETVAAHIHHALLVDGRHDVNRKDEWAA